MFLLEVTRFGRDYKDERWEAPIALHPQEIREVYPSGTGCTIEMRGGTDEAWEVFSIVESYETVLGRLRELGGAS